jgi:hypothetical protein
MATSCASTAISAWSSGAMAEMLDYIRTRIARGRIALLWLLVFGACIAAGPTASIAIIAWVALASALLIVQFRLWDDLEDVLHDRVHHPDRTLARSTDLTRFWRSLGISIIVAVPFFGVFSGKFHALAYLLLIVWLWLLYRLLRPSPAARVVRSMLVLAKYPAFVLLLAPEPWRVRTAAVAMTLYLVLAVYESRHDPDLASVRGAVHIIAGIGCVCAALLLGQGLLR